MMAGAFENPALRAELLDDVKGDYAMVKQWLERPIDGPGYSTYGEQFGLHPAFTNLVSGFAGNPTADDAKAFIENLLKALPQGADTLDVVRAWFTRAWSAEGLSLESKLAGTAAVEPASDVIRLVEQSRKDAVAPKAWRAARASLGNIDLLPEEAAEYVAVLLAMCWDIEHVPGAALDVATAWGRAIMRVSFRASGWTDELGSELESLTTSMHEKAKDAADHTDTETLRRTFMEHFQKLQTESPRFVELSTQMKQCRDVAFALQQRWVERARAELVTAAASARVG